MDFADKRVGGDIEMKSILIHVPIYIALWLLAVHIQFLMRNEKKQDKFWIYPVFTLIGISFSAVVISLLH